MSAPNHLYILYFDKSESFEFSYIPFDKREGAMCFKVKEDMPISEILDNILSLDEVDNENFKKLW